MTARPSFSAALTVLLLAAADARASATTAAAPERQEAPSEVPLMGGGGSDWPGVKVGDVLLRPRANLRGRVQAGPERDFTGNYAGRSTMSLVQSQLGLDASLGPAALVLELHDGREFLTPAETRSQVFPLDLNQGYLQYAAGQPETFRARVRLGRQAIGFGAARLMTPMRWSNIQPTYDGLRVNAQSGTLRGEAFAVRPVYKNSDEFDFGGSAYVSGEYLWGLAGRRPVVPWLSAEAYVLGLLNSRAVGRVAEGHRITTGVRLFGRKPELPLVSQLTGELKYDVEAVYQFGSTGERAIRAHALHGEVSYALRVPTTPTLRLEGNLASGDGDRTDGVARTFVPLFGKGHRPYGHMDLFWWQNMRELALAAGFSPHPTVKISAEYHLFWLDQSADEWVNPLGRPLRQVLHPADGELAAQEVDLVAMWTPVPYFQLEVAGGFMPDPGRRSATAPVGNAWRTYVQTVVQF